MHFVICAFNNFVAVAAIVLDNFLKILRASGFALILWEIAMKNLASSQNASSCGLDLP